MIILRLQGLPWSATAKDIRQHFEGLSIPDGGVHIIGGEDGDVFIAFVTDDDARKAMQRQKQPLNGSRIMLLLSSKAEMQEVIAESRAAAQSRKADPFGTSTQDLPPAPSLDQRSMPSREGSVTSSHSQSYQGFLQSDERRSVPTGYQGRGYQSSNVSVSGQSYPSQGYDTSYPPTQGNQGLAYDQPQSSVYKDYQYQDAPSTGPDGARGGGGDMYREAHPEGRQYNEHDKNRNLQRRQHPMESRLSSDRDMGYQQEAAQYGRVSRFSEQEEQRAGRGLEDKRYQQSEMYDSGTGRWSSDRDKPFPLELEKPRTLLPSPRMMGPNERRSQEPFDDPMEGISTSYPPAGPPDKFGYSQESDKDQRDTRFQHDESFGARHKSDIQQLVSGYGNENESKPSKTERGRYGQGQFGDDYWVAENSADASSKPLERRKYDNLQPFPNEGFNSDSLRGNDSMLSQRSEPQNQTNQPRNLPDDKDRYRSSSQEHGSYYGRLNQESLMDVNSQSSVYPKFQEDRCETQAFDLDRKMPSLPVHDQTASFDPDVPSQLDQSTADASKYGSNVPFMEVPEALPGTLGTSSQFYAVRLSGLPFNCNERDISQFLHGINICLHGVQFHRDSRGYSAGTANVKLEGPHDLDGALKRHQQYMGKRYIDIRPCLQSEWEKEEEVPAKELTTEVTKRGRSRSPIRHNRSPLRGCNTSIEITGLSSYTKNVEIADFFEGLRVKSSGIYFDQSRDVSNKGVAYVEFVDPDNARRACQRSGKQLGRRSVTIRLISKEIMDAKINVDMKKKSERRSPGKRSPDRRRGSSPHGRRGRSPSRRGRSPVRSSRSSPGRNGPGRKASSPSKRDNRDRESSRSGKRGQSPTRHSSQDRKGVPTEKRDKKEADSKEATPTSNSSSRVEDSKSSRSDAPKQSSLKPLLQSPDSKEILLKGSNGSHQEENRGQGLLKTPDQQIVGRPSDPHCDQLLEMESRPRLSTPETAGRPILGRSDNRNAGLLDERGRDLIQNPSIAFQRNQSRVSRFDQGAIDWQAGERRQGPVQNVDRTYPLMHEDHPNSRQGLMGMSDRGPLDNREELGSDGAMTLNPGFSRFPDGGQRDPDDRRRGLMENMLPGMDARHGSSIDERRSRSVDSRRGLLDDPRDDRHQPSDWERGPVNERGPMGRRQGEPIDGRQASPVGFNLEGPTGPGSRRTLLERPVGEQDDHLGGHVEDREMDYRVRDMVDRREPGRMNEVPGGAHPRDRSPGDGRMGQGNHSNQEWEPHGQGRGGLVGRDFLGEPDADRRKFPSQQGNDKFPNQSNIPMLFDTNEGDGRRMAFEGDHLGERERQFGSQERSDRRSMARHGPEDVREPHRELVPKQRDQGRPLQESEGGYVCSHIRNVPYQARWPEIAQFFSGLQIVPGGIHIMVGPDGRPNGHCFIEFVDAHQARLTEERRLHTMRDRPLQINACSKAMMIGALEQSGELQQSRPPQNLLAQRGGGEPFGPRGPRPDFHGNPRGPFPGPGPRGPGPHLHRPGPHQGGPGPRQGGPGPYQDGPGPHHHGGPFRPPFEEARGRDAHSYSRSGPGPREGDRNSERSHRQDNQPIESPKLEEQNKEKEATKQPPKKPEPESKKETEIKNDPKPDTVPTIHFENHKGCVISATNLPLTITVESIKDFFKGFETVNGAIKVDTNESTGKATGEAKIVFNSSSEANRAIKERNNRPLNGRIVRLHVV